MEGGSERRDSRLHTCIQHPRKPSVSVCVSIHTGLEFRGRAVDLCCVCVFWQGYKQQRAFIIAQGPMKSTSRDFWKMIFSRKCSVIVMLSDLCEQGEVNNISPTHCRLITVERPRTTCFIPRRCATNTGQVKGHRVTGNSESN